MNDKGYAEEPISPQYGVQPYKANVPSTTLVNYDYSAEDVHLRDYLAVIMKRKWVVVSFLVSVVIITMAVTFMLLPFYKSTVVIRIDRAQNANPLKNQQVMEEPDYYQTQYEIIKSQALAERVIRKLSLDKNRDFLSTSGRLEKAIWSLTDSIGRLISMIGASGSPKAKRSSDEMPLFLLTKFTKRLDVVPVKNSQLVQVSFSSISPELSVAVTKAIADTYMEYSLQSRVDASKDARDFLKSQIELAKTKLEESEKKLNDYASKNEIIYLDSDKKSVLVQNLSEITSALSGVASERMQKEALYRQIKESGDDNPVILNNALIQELKRQHATLESEYSNKLKTFTPDYPAMVNLKSQLDTIQRRIDKEKSALEASIVSDFKAALKKEAYLKSAFQAQQRKVLGFQDKAAEYQLLKREADVNKDVHNALLQKFNEVGIAAMSQTTNIQVIDSPRFPTLPYTPNKVLNFVLSILFGLTGGVGLAFLLEYFDNTIKDTREIERRTNLPSLGMIPFQPKLGRTELPKLVYSGQSRSVTEAFRSIGTFILLSSSAKPPKTILVTSPGEKEGKSTVSVNVALALAESIGNGVIIDADMRRPKLHHAFRIDNRTGLSSYLSGNVNFEELDSKLLKHPSEKGLSVITAGPIPPNPSKLLHTSKMKELLDCLYATYNFVIIDASPVIGIPDSVLLSKIVDGTILVIRAGETPRNALSATRQIFRDVNTNLLGVVLNGVKRDDIRYTYQSSYFSSYFSDVEPK